LFGKFRHILPRQSPARLVLSGLLIFALVPGCAYYNYFYNAKKYYDQGERQQRERAAAAQSRRSVSSTPFDKCIESAGKMLLYYPGSRWEDDALLLIAKAYYQTGKYRSAVGKVDELEAKYPESVFLPEALLWKGASLFKLAQPDSARQILTLLFAAESADNIRAQAHYAVGDYHFGEKRWAPALEQFRLAAQVVGNDWLRGEAWIKSAECYMALRQFEAAVELYDEILLRKIPRRLRFEASLKRAVVIKEAGRPSEAFETLEKLLKDKAFVDDFPRVELEIGRCLIVIGLNEEARRRLERLVETEKRGELAAQAQFELGRLLWLGWRDYNAASIALREVKNAERSATVASVADSLLSEVETLTRFYQRLAFLDRQLSLLDSVRAGLCSITKSDTVFIDSLALKKDKPTDRKKPEVRARARDPIQRMVDEAQFADSSKDSAKVKVVEAARLDSAAITALDSLRRLQQIGARFSLAEYHLFVRRDLDSAKAYINQILPSLDSGEVWARSLATLAYIAQSQKDSAQADSILQLMLAKSQQSQWRDYARAKLCLPMGVTVSDSERLFAEAESTWTTGNAEMARQIYLLIAATADSTQPQGAQALLAAAYISRKEFGQDTLAKKLYSDVVTRFPNSPYAKLAAKRAGPRGADKGDRVKPPEKKIEPEEMLEDRLDLLAQDYPSEDFPAAGAEIFAPDSVDETPILITSPELLKNHLRNFYPFEAFSENARGEAEIEFVVTNQGKIQDIKVLYALPEDLGFERAAVDVVNVLQFNPGRKMGRSVSVRIKQKLVFPASNE